MPPRPRYGAGHRDVPVVTTFSFFEITKSEITIASQVLNRSTLDDPLPWIDPHVREHVSLPSRRQVRLLVPAPARDSDSSEDGNHDDGGRHPIVTGTGITPDGFWTWMAYHGCSTNDATRYKRQPTDDDTDLDVDLFARFFGMQEKRMH